MIEVGKCYKFDIISVKSIDTFYLKAVQVGSMNYFTGKGFIINEDGSVKIVKKSFCNSDKANITEIPESEYNEKLESVEQIIKELR